MPREYYLHDGDAREGPITRHEILTRIEDGELDPLVVLGWHRDAPGWVAVAEMPEFEGAETVADEEEIVVEADEEGDEEDPLHAIPGFSILEPRAEAGPFFLEILLRGIARAVDAVFVWYLLAFVVRLLAGDSLDGQWLLHFLFLLFALVVYESFFLARTGTTPGKRLLGVIVVPGPRAKRPRDGVLFRSLFAWVTFFLMLSPPFGLALIPLIFMLWHRAGETPWDKLTGFRAGRIEASVGGMVAASLLVALQVVFLLFALLQYGSTVMRQQGELPSGEPGAKKEAVEEGDVPADPE